MNFNIPTDFSVKLHGIISGLKPQSTAELSAIGALRVLNNRHWAGDVIAGAGFGILSAKLSEWIIEPHGKKTNREYFLN